MENPAQSESIPTAATSPDAGTRAAGDRGGKLWGVTVGLVLLGAALIRVRGGLNDLWLDEVWSLFAAKSLSAPWQVVTSLHHEINHHLNTLWIYIAGFHGNWAGYRIPSIVAGVGSVAMAGAIAARRGKMEMMAALLAFGFSYVLVLYSSEARGYSTAIFCALVAFYCMEKLGERRSLGYVVLFWAAEIIGLLSHLTFVNVMAATGCWSLVRECKDGWPGWQMVPRLLRQHGVPGVCLAVLYYLDIRLVINGGGSPATSLLDVFGSALAWAMGTSLHPAARLVSCIVGVSFLAAGLGLLRRRTPEVAVFFLCVTVLCPVGLVIVRASDAVYPRHFLLSGMFLLLLASLVVAELWRAGKFRRGVALLVVVAYLAVNARNIGLLFEHGRGSVANCVQQMAAAGPADRPIAVAADQDFRAMNMLQFFGPIALGGKSISYFKKENWPREGVDFVIFHGESYEPPVNPGATVNDRFGHSYRLVGTFQAAPLAGIHLFLYQRTSR